MFGLTTYNQNRNLFPDPFQELDAMTRGFFGRDTMNFSMDIRDAGDAYELEADLPGMKKEDIHIDLDGDYMTITAERRSESENRDEQNNYVRCERSYGSFSRRVDISAVDAENITASYTDGVLKLTMPKKTAAIPASRRLEIQ